MVELYSQALRSLPHLTAYDQVSLSSALRFLGLFPPGQFAPSLSLSSSSTSLSSSASSPAISTVHQEFSFNTQAVNTWLYSLFSKSNSTYPSYVLVYYFSHNKVLLLFLY